MPALKERLDNFTAAIPDVKKGDVLTLTYVPGKGTSVRARVARRSPCRARTSRTRSSRCGWASAGERRPPEGMLGKDD